MLVKKKGGECALRIPLVSYWYGLLVGSAPIYIPGCSRCEGIWPAAAGIPATGKTLGMLPGAGQIGCMTDAIRGRGREAG